MYADDVDVEESMFAFRSDVDFRQSASKCNIAYTLSRNDSDSCSLSFLLQSSCEQSSLSIEVFVTRDAIDALEHFLSEGGPTPLLILLLLRIIAQLAT